LRSVLHRVNPKDRLPIQTMLMGVTRVTEHQQL
jgi:hypothetical protein